MGRVRTAGALILAAVVGAGALQAAVGPGAAAAGKGKYRADILVPKDGHQIRGDELELRVRARGPRFGAYLNGEDISDRFERRGSVRTAVLRRGRDFRPGDLSLFVRVGKRGRAESEIVYYYATRRNDGAGSLNVKSTRVPHAAPRIHLRTKRPIREFKTWLNGRRVDREFDRDGDDRGVSNMPGAHSGVRHGRNRVVLKAVLRGGTVIRKERTFEVAARQPIAGAGRDHRVGVGQPIRLDAGATEPHEDAGDLSYRWSVLSAPEGSQAGVANAKAAKPTFVPDVPGSYELRLKVSDEHGHRSVDDVRVDAPQTDGPMGIPIQTRTSTGEHPTGIQLGNDSYAPEGTWVQMLVLKAGNATLDSGRWGDANQPFAAAQSADLLAKVKTIGSDHLVILAGRCCDTPTAEQAADLEAAFEHLGGTVQSWGPTPSGAQDLGGNNYTWSLLGEPGLARGAANQNLSFSVAGVPGFMSNSRGQQGSLNGYLQIAATGDTYDFISGEQVPLDTKWTPSVDTPPSNTQNVIEVGDKQYESKTIDQGDVAIQLLQLDPSDLSLFSNETYGVINYDHSTNFDGIAALNEALHDINSAHQLNSSPLVILQDFGQHANQADWPAGNSTEWLQDTIPDTGWTPNWSGNQFDNSTAALFESWNSAGPNGSVAGNLGELVGPWFHDVIANYRRPYFDPDANGPGEGAVIPRTSGGLTVVAQPHLYQWSSAFGQGQSDPSLTDYKTLGIGRVTGTLTRNEQSQWELKSNASGAGFNLTGNPFGPEQNLLDPSAMWELVFQPPSPWPCSVELPAPCPAAPAEIDQANRYIAGRLFNRAVFDIRDKYTTKQDWDGLATKMNGIPGQPAPYPPGRGFSREVYDALRAQLTTEFTDLAAVKTGIDGWENVIGASGKDANININDAGSKVTAAVHDAAPDILTEEAEINAAATTGDTLHLAATLVELGLIAGAGPESLAFAPPALGAITAVIGLGDALGQEASGEPTPSETLAEVDDDTEAIRDSVANLAKDLNARYDTINATLTHFEDVFATDPRKLAQAASSFRNAWALDSAQQKLIGRTITLGAMRQMYTATAPIAYRQWMISPRGTRFNGDGALELPATNYQCVQTNGDIGNPNGGMPVGGTTSVAWGSNTPHSTHYTVRFLKAAVNNLEVETERDDVRMHAFGANPAALVINPLFEPATLSDDQYKPTYMGMSKDAFFGGPMSIQMLQCGEPAQ